MSLDTFLEETRLINTGFCEKQKENISKLYDEENNNYEIFWNNRAKKLDWIEPWRKTVEWEKPHAKWFINGKLNASANCLDSHLDNHAQKKAIIWESEKGESVSLTYEDLHQKVISFAHQLKHTHNINKGDRVTIYMPMVPELAIAVLACARIGAIHSVVFAGFSAKSLQDRIQDSQSTCLITADGGYRRGKVIPLKDIVSNALENHACPSLKNVIIHQYIQANAPLPQFNSTPVHKFICDSIIEPKDDPIETMDSEDPLFILYTSGTTGKPKGIVHSTGGYMTHAKYSSQLVFDLKEDDIYWCTADVGWITGHSYMIYGPLSNASTIVMFEGTPDYPSQSRFWELIEKHKVSIFYTAPTAIRSFMKWGNEHITKHDLSSLRLLGTVGEPINPEAWIWYHDVIGNKNCPIVDTWWQTETGGIILTTLPSYKPSKPGSAGFALPGLSVDIKNEQNETITNGAGLLSITKPWPSMLRGVWGDEQRFKDTYWSTLDTYFAGDGASIDENGYITVIGRIDDVLNVAGHRIGTMEVESALVEHPAVAEAAVVGIQDDIKGQAIVAFTILKEGTQETNELISEINGVVNKHIGAIAKPKFIVCTPDLPKTRSGKIMRRLLKQVADGEEVGDTTTLGNPDIIHEIKEKMTLINM